MALHTQSFRQAVMILTCCVMCVSACGDDDGSPDAGGDPTLCNPALGGVGQCVCATGTRGIRYCTGTGDMGRWGSCMCNEPQPPMPCTVGATSPCFCANGSMGLRECRPQNTYTACMCANDTQIDAGHLDAASDNDGG